MVYNNSKENTIQNPKKFVFKIYPENIKYIESLSYQEKQDFINILIKNHRENKHLNYESSQFIKNFVKVIALVIFIIIGIPLLLFLINASLNMTKSSYMDMQRNFEKLF
ncbi:MAG: hypothetical protein V2B14_05790 [bacterium]